MGKPGFSNTASALLSSELLTQGNCKPTSANDLYPYHRFSASQRGAAFCSTAGFTDQGRSPHLRSSTIAHKPHPANGAHFGGPLKGRVDATLVFPGLWPKGQEMGRSRSQGRSSLEASTDPITTTSPLWVPGLCARILPWGNSTWLPPA